jgi:hypothetical protein
MITPEMLGSVVGKEFDKLSTKDIVKLRNLYNAIKDGFVKAEVAFGTADAGPANGLPSQEEEETLEKLNEKLGAKS